MTAPVAAIVRRDLRKYFRNPGLIAVALLMPLVQMVMIGYAIGGQIRDVRLILVDEDGGPEARRVHSMLRAIEAGPRTFRVRTEPDPRQAFDLVQSGAASAAVLIPREYSRRALQGRPQLVLITDNTDLFVASAAEYKMRELVASLEKADLGAALHVVETFPFVEYVQYLFPGAIAAAIYISCVIGGGILYVDDKARGIHEGYLVTPVSSAELLAGVVLSGIAKAAFAGAFVTLAGAAIAGVGLTTSKLAMLAALDVLIASTLVTFVTLLMVRVSDPLKARAVFSMLTTILYFPSGAIYPIAGFPEWMRTVARYDPFTYAVHALRTVVLKSPAWDVLRDDLLVLAGVAVVCFAAAAMLFPRRL